MNLSNKSNPEEWQVLFLTHTVDESVAHSEVPSDNETLYSILNAFQEGKKQTIGNINVDYTDQGKGTVIAIITGHHHMDTTTIKNNLLIITVRSASGVNDRNSYHAEQYNKDDISFDLFTVDTKTKNIYATKVGRGNDRSWSYDIDNLKELTNSKRTRTNTTNSSKSGIEVNCITDWNNHVIAIVKSDSEFVEKTNQTWKLGTDKKTYIKVLDDVSSPYTTTFTNVNGETLTYTFNLDQLTDMTGPELSLEYQNNEDGTITAVVTSNEILKTKSNIDWKISEDRQTYKYTFTQNTNNYTTKFNDVFENATSLTLNAKIFDVSITYQENNDGTITAYATSNTKLAATKPTWTLSSDGYTYSKTFTTNQNYSTTFMDIFGNAINQTIRIGNLTKEMTLNIKNIENDDGTVTVYVTSNTKLAATKPTWSLSSDGYTYSKAFTANQNYSTTFMDIYGNIINQTILIDQYNKEANVDIMYVTNLDGSVTAKVTSKAKFAPTKPTWTLSSDAYTYTKTFYESQNYNTIFTDVLGRNKNVNININM